MDCGSCEEIIGRILAMLLTVFLTIVFCVAITLMMFSAVAFIQDKKFFSSAPKEAQEALFPVLFPGS